AWGGSRQGEMARYHSSTMRDPLQNSNPHPKTFKVAPSELGTTGRSPSPSCLRASLPSPPKGEGNYPSRARGQHSALSPITLLSSSWGLGWDGRDEPEWVREDDGWSGLRGRGPLMCVARERARSDRPCPRQPAWADRRTPTPVGDGGSRSRSLDSYSSVASTRESDAIE